MENETSDIKFLTFLETGLKKTVVNGLIFGIPPTKLNFANFFLSFEILLRSLYTHKPSSKVPQAQNHIKLRI